MPLATLFGCLLFFTFYPSRANQGLFGFTATQCSTYTYTYYQDLYTYSYYQDYQPSLGRRVDGVDCVGSVISMVLTSVSDLRNSFGGSSTGGYW